MPDTSSVRAWWARRPPAAGAAVMATGIVSVTFQLMGHETLSRIVLVLACVAWLALAAVFVMGLLTERERWAAAASTPGALTAVAATTVVGTRFSLLGWQVLAEALLALSVVLWAVLLFLVLRNLGRRMPGAVFLICVATQGLVVLGSTLAKAESVAWLAHTAMVLFWCGIALYLVALLRFDPRQVLAGSGDHWIAGGALAISALAGAKLVLAEHGMYLWSQDDSDVLDTVTVALLVLDLAWYLVLAVGEFVRPRLRYDVRRWGTVFPMGMTAAATLSVSTATAISWGVLGHVLGWISLLAWLVVAVGAAASARVALRSTAPR